MKGDGMKIGVLALQGAFAEHIGAFNAFPGVEGVEIRQRADFTDSLSGLILPGGESTVMAKLLAELKLFQPIADAIRHGMPVFGTCAGMILLASAIEGYSSPHFGLLDITVRRNAYGRQIDSFSTSGDFAGQGGIEMVFIRAPGIARLGFGVETLASARGQPVAVRQNNIMATAFHPELTGDLAVHKYFLGMAASRASVEEARSA